jgi:hypothetical protein
MLVKSLTLDKIKQLVDINGDLTNFKATIQVSPASSDEYEVAFVNQTILDNAEDFSYQTKSGPFSYSFESLDDMYQNHFLCLKSKSPLPVEVSIDATELPTTTVKNRVEPPAPVPVIQETPFYRKLWFKCFVLAVILVIVYWIYTRYFEKSDSVPAPVETAMELPVPVELPPVEIPETPVEIPEVPVEIPEIPVAPPPPPPVVEEPPSVKVRFQDDPTSDYNRKKSEFTSRLLSRLRGDD